MEIIDTRMKLYMGQPPPVLTLTYYKIRHFPISIPNNQIENYETRFFSPLRRRVCRSADVRTAYDVELEFARHKIILEETHEPNEYRAKLAKGRVQLACRHRVASLDIRATVARRKS